MRTILQFVLVGGLILGVGALGGVVGALAVLDLGKALGARHAAEANALLPASGCWRS